MFHSLNLQNFVLEGANVWGKAFIIINHYIIVDVFIIRNDCIFHSFFDWQGIVNGSARNIITIFIVII